MRLQLFALSGDVDLRRSSLEKDRVIKRHASFLGGGK